MGNFLCTYWALESVSSAYLWRGTNFILLRRTELRDYKTSSQLAGAEPQLKSHLSSHEPFWKHNSWPTGSRPLTQKNFPFSQLKRCSIQLSFPLLNLSLPPLPASWTLGSKERLYQRETKHLMSFTDHASQASCLTYGLSFPVYKMGKITTSSSYEE